MKLNMHVLEDELSEFELISYLNESTQMTINSIELVSNPIDIYQKDTLYLLGSSDLLSREGKLKNTNLLCAGRVEEAFVKRNGCNLIAISENLTVLELANHIFKIQQKYDDWNDRMLSVILLKQSLQRFFEVALERIQSAMMLLGPMNTLLLVAGELKESYQGSIWDELLEKGYLSSEHPLYHEFLKKAYEYHEEREAFIVSIPKYNYEYLTVNIFQDGKMCGAIQLIEKNKHFTLGQVALVSYIRSILEQAIKSISDFQILSANTNSFVYQLLQHVYVKESIIENSLNARGWKISDEYYCMLFLCGHPENEKAVVKSFLMQELSRNFPRAILLDYKSGIVVVMCNFDFKYNQGDINKKLSIIVEKFNLVSGISSVFYDFKELKRYYEECKLAVKYGKDINPGMRIHFFEDYIINHLTRFIFVENGKNQYINSKVELLHKYDEQNGTEFVKTLLTYFLYGQSKSLAAEKMHLHRNSLVYRLDTICKISGIDCINRMLNENEIFHIMLSCKFVI